jgi:hypothetical protein
MKQMKTPHHFQKVIAVLRKFMAVLSMHDDDGTHLQGGVPNDSIWQGYHRRLVTLPPQLYTRPGKGAGKDFIDQLCEEFTGVTERKWNSERPLVFCLAMLQKKPGIT